MPSPLPQPNWETQEMTRARDSFLGPYRIELKIGDGGMGVVYKCHDPKLKRFVAIKVLKEKYSRAPEYHQRLQREAQAIACLSHPNIAHIHAIEDGIPPYLVMEYVDGSSAEAILRDGPLSAARAAAIVREAALGLRAALEKGIIHRDVKPSNILIAANGAVKLVDFGLAKVIEGTQAITEEGMVLGTPHYISPEQGRGQKVDQRSDIYSLGATFYHLVTGRPPFDGDTQVAVIVAHLNDVPRPPHEVRAEVPEALSLVIGKMMAKDPARRYPSYGELIADLERLGRGEPIARETATSGAETFRAEARRVPARFFWAAGAAVALAVAATLVLVKVFLPGGGEAGLLQRLDGWYIHQDAEQQCFNASFQSPPERLTRSEALNALFLLGSRNAERVSLEAPGPRLLLRDPAEPLALRFPFLRLDEVLLQGVRVEGRLDLALALVHPQGARLRSLLFCLRAGPPAPGREAGRGAEGTAEPIRAERNADRVAISPPPPPAPRLGPGPYDIEVRLRREAGAVRVHLEVHRAGGAGEPVYQSDAGEWLRIPGEDWGQGALLLWSPSPLRPSSLAVERILAAGLVDTGGALAGSPWDQREAAGRLAQRTDHGEADRR